MAPLSHLQRAVLHTLETVPCGPDGWVDRSRFDAELRQDAWVARNPHRLARLESTLCALAHDGLLLLRADAVARPPSPRPDRSPLV